MGIRRRWRAELDRQRSGALDQRARQPGDFNRDGVVDAADFILLRKNNGSSADDNIWQTHFGEHISGGSGALFGSSVPEPATGICLMWALTPIVFRRNRKFVI